MKYINFICIFLIFTIKSYSEIRISIYKHMKFKEVNTRSIGQNIVGMGILELYADEEDFGKIVTINFHDKGYMTNRKHWIEVQNLSVEDKDKEFVINQKTKQIKFYGTIDKKKIDRNIQDIDIIEGEYIGATPIILSIYAKGGNSKDE